MIQARCFGFRPDPPDLVHHPAAVMLDLARQGVLGAPASTAGCSLRRFRDRMRYQGGLNACVGVGAARQFHLWARARGSAAEFPSARVLWWEGRAAEFAGRDADEVRTLLGNQGIYPFLAFEAYRRVGFVPDSLCPYPDGPDLWDPHVLDRVTHEQPPPIVFVSGFSQRGLMTSRVVESGLDRVRRIAELTKAGFPVGFGLQVDVPFLDNHGEFVDSVDPARIVGGHWLVVLEVTDEYGKPLAGPEEVTATSRVVTDTTWENHGEAVPDGFVVRIAADVMGSSYVSDVTAASFVPFKESVS